jgi:hypothetical protein
MFRAVPLPIIRSLLTVHLALVYVIEFEDSLQAGSGWNAIRKVSASVGFIIKWKSNFLIFIREVLILVWAGGSDILTEGVVVPSVPQASSRTLHQTVSP